MQNILALLAQIEVDADKAISQAATLGELVYFLVVAMCLATVVVLSLGGLLLWKWFFPSQATKREIAKKDADSKRERDEKESAARIAHSEKISSAVERIVGLQEQSQIEHHEFRKEVRDEFGKIHQKFNGLKNNPPL